MIPRLLADVLIWFLDGALALFTFVIPAGVVAVATSGFGTMAQMLSYGPAGIVGLCMAGYFVLDTALNAFVFSLSVYRLIPLKGT